MARGKQTCKILKEIRKQIAEENDIKLVIEECTYQGDCLGTCPKCEAEVRYLERELEKRQRLGKAAVFAGMSIGTLLTAAACDTTAKVTEKPLAGDVVAIAPEPDTIIEEPLMGIVAMFRMNYEFGAKEYENLMKGKFVFPEMKNLSIIGGDIEYENIARGEVYDTFEKLVEATQKFEAPYYLGGEEKMLVDLFLQLKVDASQYKGDMEVAFTVDMTGDLKDVAVVKGVDKTLDDAVIAVFQRMRWHPAYIKLKEEYESWPFDCRCVLKIHFPIDIEPVPLEGEPVILIEDQ